MDEASFGALRTSENMLSPKETARPRVAVQPTYQLLFFPYFTLAADLVRAGV